MLVIIVNIIVIFKICEIYPILSPMQILKTNTFPTAR